MAEGGELRRAGLGEGQRGKTGRCGLTGHAGKCELCSRGKRQQLGGEVQSGVEFT